MITATKALTNLLSGKTILVVEDEPDSLEVAQILLEMYGATVMTATNGREGIDQARKRRPSFIISDLSMPEMSGWEMIHILKNDRLTIDIPVIALTAHAMTGDRERALAAGFHNYLTKPLIPPTFVNDLMRLIADSPEIVQPAADSNTSEISETNEISKISEINEISVPVTSTPKES